MTTAMLHPGCAIASARIKSPKPPLLTIVLTLRKARVALSRWRHLVGPHRRPPDERTVRLAQPPKLFGKNSAVLRQGRFKPLGHPREPLIAELDVSLMADRAPRVDVLFASSNPTLGRLKSRQAQVRPSRR